MTAGAARHAGHELLVAGALVVLAAASALAVRGALGRLDLSGPLVSDDAGGPPGPEVTPRRPVLLVVVDGLRADASRELPFLARLADGGARAELRADPPTWSAAQWTAILSGVPPRDSGRRTNAALTRVGVDTLARRVRAQGRPARLIADEYDWWGTLLGDDLTSFRIVPGPRLPAALRDGASDAGLAIVHLGEVDHAGHRAGASSTAYRAAARAADRTLAELAGAWGWPAAPVAVVSDHGHTARGGHGGGEPEVRRTWLVLAGPGVRRGARLADAPVSDVAPTLAALAGAPAPRQARGRALSELLVLPPGAADALADADARRAAALAPHVARRVGAIEAGERRDRALRAAAALALLAVAGLLLRRAPAEARIGAAAGLAAAACAAALYAASGGRLSFSEARLAALVASRAVLSGLAPGAALAVVALVVARRRARAGGPPVALAALAAGAASGALAPAGAIVAVVGPSGPRLAPGSAQAVAPLVTYAASSGLLAALAALAGAGWLARARRARSSRLVPPAPPPPRARATHARRVAGAASAASGADGGPPPGPAPPARHPQP